MECKDIDIS